VLKEPGGDFHFNRRRRRAGAGKSRQLESVEGRASRAQQEHGDKAIKSVRRIVLLANGLDAQTFSF